MKVLSKVTKGIFYISFLYYIYWIIYDITLYWRGIASNWLIPLGPASEVYYGFEAMGEGFGVFIVWTVIFFWWIPLYQILYLIIKGITKIIDKRKLKEDKIDG